MYNVNTLGKNTFAFSDIFTNFNYDSTENFDCDLFVTDAFHLVQSGRSEPVLNYEDLKTDFLNGLVKIQISGMILLLLWHGQNLVDICGGIIKLTNGLTIQIKYILKIRRDLMTLILFMNGHTKREQNTLKIL